MTTNQTIDGVSRELLERLLVATAADSTPANPAWYVEELRAMLDAPAEPKPTGLSQGWNLTRKHDGFVVGHQSVAYPPDEKAIERAERDDYVWVPFLVLAAQPQGEPVAWHVDREEPGHLGGYCSAAMKANGVGFQGHTKPLYAEQPAPVAVVLPEHRDSDLRSPVYGFAKGWNACLDELKRLNPYL